jgi:hypothetical protein
LEERRPEDQCYEHLRVSGKKFQLLKSGLAQLVAPKRHRPELGLNDRFLPIPRNQITLDDASAIEFNANRTG